MGRYDIGKKMTRSCHLTIIDLCRELVDEFEEKYPDDTENWSQEETIKKLFSNDDKSGLINKLTDKLNFDIETMALSSDKEKFDKLKLLKLLYYIEKFGESKNAPVDIKERRILITDILAKPRLENIFTEFSKKSVYGSIFEDLLEKVRREVSDADERDKKLTEINTQWEFIVGKTLDYVISDRALKEKEDANFELDRLNFFLEKRILERLSGISLDVMRSKENVMKTFYNILISHKFLCNDVERLHINYRICIEEPPLDEFINKVKKYEGYEVSWFIIDELEELICKGKKTKGAEFLLDLISYGFPIRDDEMKAYRFAIKNFKTVLGWWIKEATDNVVLTSVSVDTVVLILQEMVVVNKYKEGFRNDYLGYNNPFRSLSVAVTKPHEADAVAIQVWIKKLENRTAVNFGAYELIKKKRAIENTIFGIKQIIYGYQNLEDLEFANKIVSHLAARSLMSRGGAMSVCDRFTEKVWEQLIGNAKNIRFFLGAKSINVYDMLREFTFDIYNIEDLVATDVARQINEFYARKDSIIETGMSCDFEICTSETSCKDFLLTFTVNRENNQFHYQQFVNVSSDKDCDRMRRIGLGKFVNDDYPMFF